MDKYEIFKLQFTEKVKRMCPDLSVENLDTILACLDQTATDYEVQSQCTDIIAVNPDGIPEVLKLFLTSLAIEDKSKGTLKDYRLHLQHMFRTIKKPFDQITTNDLRVYIYTYKTENGVKNSTLDHRRIVINSFYNWCKHEGLIQVNPCETIRAIHVPEVEHKPLEQMELEIIRDACKDNRDKAIIDFLYSTGCRAEEATQMKIKDIDWTDHSAIVRHGKGDKQRTVYLNAECEISLKKYLNTRHNQTEYVFSPARKPTLSPLTPKTIQSIIQKIIGRVNDPLHCHVTPHVFRHTAATTALHNGMPIEQVRNFLGHSNINTTMIYAKVDSEDVKNSHSKYLN